MEGDSAPAAGLEDRPYRRIATEEAWAPPELFAEYRRILDSGEADVGFASLMGYFLTSSHPQPRTVVERLTSLGPDRLAAMDATGIARQVIAMTAPGTQVLDPDTATAMARLANDRLAEAVRDHPDRYTGLASVGLEDAGTAVEELDRAVNQLGLRGLMVNSHVKGQYLDHPRFRPILEKVADLGVPLYLHPQTLPGPVVGPWQEAGLDGAIWGFAAETGLHLLRIITSGTLDRVPGLRVVVGHLGEGLPYFAHRIDHMHAKQVASGRYEAIRPLEQRPSEYLRTHVWLTTSGMPATLPILFAREVVGRDRVMYAMDYPYQYEAAEVAEQDALPIPDEEKAAFFQGIAEEVFGIG
ncbi:amidohydrolase [Citricoccus sp. SGAir0253]|uniref:amidohydrolase family protein n=1 Tax=Citricoccus sp. SGAir0253 TaxID=2567881 RepID=UPI0010CD4923|nr:amidohydrolase family protein [Citricoccus sp. SGAir0253]QCU77571.1 amidohydrolase [Citricoccus sp. SGAir0253]